MKESIKAIFEEECSHVKINRSLLKDIRNIRLSFINRNEDHLNFFSSTLLGVYPIRFLTTDRQQWFDEILEVDEEDIKKRLRKVEAIQKESWVRAKDPYNHACIWLLHKIQTNTSISAREKEQGSMDVLLMLQYKFITSLMAHSFPYPADKDTAIATYEALSRKFEIKKYGSWQGLLEHRAEMVLDKNGIWYNKFMKFNDDKEIIDMFQDIQGRLKEVVKKMNKIFYRVKENKLKIVSTKSTVIFEGEVKLIEKTRDQTAYNHYIKTIINDKPTFIRSELLEIIYEIMHTMTPEHLDMTLSYVSDNFGKGGDKNVEKLVDELIYHVFRYLSDTEGLMSSKGNLGQLLLKLKNIYSASRMSDSQLIEIKELGSKIISKGVNTRNDAALASVRTGLFLYIVLRTFSKTYYGS